MAGWNKRSPAPLHDLFPAQSFDPVENFSPVTTLDSEQPEQPEPVETLEAQEARLLALVAASEELRKQKVRREAEQQAREALEAQRLHEAVTGLQRIADQKAAEARRAEQTRLAKIAEDYEAGPALADLVRGAIDAYTAQQANGDGIECLRSVFSERFGGIDAPPAELWQSDGPRTGECFIFGGKIRVHVDCRAGLDSPSVILSGVDGPLDGVGALLVPDRSALGKYLAEYVEAAALFGIARGDVPEPAQLEGDVDIAEFGSAL